jgi:hypothetical protein
VRWATLEDIERAAARHQHTGIPAVKQGDSASSSKRKHWSQPDRGEGSCDAASNGRGASCESTVGSLSSNDAQAASTDLVSALPDALSISVPEFASPELDGGSLRPAPTGAADPAAPATASLPDDGASEEGGADDGDEDGARRCSDALSEAVPAPAASDAPSPLSTTGPLEDAMASAAVTTPLATAAAYDAGTARAVAALAHLDSGGASMSTNPVAHITLSTAHGVEPRAANAMLRRAAQRRPSLFGRGPESAAGAPQPLSARAVVHATLGLCVKAGGGRRFFLLDQQRLLAHFNSGGVPGQQKQQY